MRFLPHVLIIEDEHSPGDLSQLVPHTTPQGDPITALVVHTAAQANAAMQTAAMDVVLVDLRWASSGGLTLTRDISAAQPHIDIICWVDAAGLVEDTRTLGNVVTLAWDAASISRLVLSGLQNRRVVLENQHLLAHHAAADRQVEALRRSLAQQLQQRTVDLQEANTRLSQLTVTDDVTGLYNQRFLHTRLEEEFYRARRYHEALAVMMLDIDAFKHVNDTHDHIYGSRVLRHVGEILRRGVRETDMVIRYGGDEFVVILPHTNLNDAKIVGERLRLAVASHDVGADGDAYFLTMSVGIAARDALHAASGRDLLLAADRGLYRAKQNGRNCVVAARSQVPGVAHLARPQHHARHLAV